jgi:hypothetical protein
MPLPERREFGADRTNEAVSCRRCLSYGNFEVNGSYVVWDPFKDWGNVQTGDYVGLKVCLVDGANDPTASHCDSATVRSSDG